MKKIDLVIIGIITLIFVFAVGCQPEKKAAPKKDLPPPPPPVPTEGMETITGGVVVETLTGDEVPDWAASPGFEKCISYISYDAEEGMTKTFDPIECGATKLCVWKTMHVLKKRTLPDGSEELFWQGVESKKTGANKGWFCTTSNEITINYPIKLENEENFMLQYFCGKINGKWACPNPNEQKWILETTTTEKVPDEAKDITGWTLIAGDEKEAIYYKDGEYITVTVEELSLDEIISRIKADFTKNDWNSAKHIFENDKTCWKSFSATGETVLVCFDKSPLPTNIFEKYSKLYPPDPSLVNDAFPPVAPPNATTTTPLTTLTSHCGNGLVEPQEQENCEPPEYNENNIDVCIASIGNLDLRGMSQSDLEALNTYGEIKGVDYEKLYNFKCQPNICQCVLSSTNEPLKITKPSTPPMIPLYCGDGIVTPPEQCEWFNMGGWSFGVGCPPNFICQPPGSPNACKCLAPVGAPPEESMEKPVARPPWFPFPLGNPGKIGNFGFKNAQRQGDEMHFVFEDEQERQISVLIGPSINTKMYDCEACRLEDTGIISCHDNDFYWMSKAGETDIILEVFSTSASVERSELQEVINAFQEGYPLNLLKTKAHYVHSCAAGSGVTGEIDLGPVGISGTGLAGETGTEATGISGTEATTELSAENEMSATGTEATGESGTEATTEDFDRYLGLALHKPMQTKKTFDTSDMLIFFMAGIGVIAIVMFVYFGIRGFKK